MPDLPGTPQVPQLPLPSETVYQAVGQVMESDLLATALVRDDDGRIVWANGSYAAVTGYGFDEVAGRTQEFLHGPGTDTDVIDRARARVREGHAEPLTVLLYRKNGTPFWSRIAAVPISLDGTGQADYHAVIHFESTAEIFHERAQSAQDAIVENRADRLELVNRVVRALTSQVDYHRAADALARTAVPELADWGFVVLFDDDGAPEYFTDVVADPSKAESARTVESGLPHWIGEIAWAGQAPRLHQALKAGPGDLVLPQLVDLPVLTETVTARHYLEALYDLGVGARLAVPLHTRDRTLGLMMLESANLDRFDVPTVITTTLLRGRVGAVLDNIRRYQAVRPGALTSTYPPPRPGTPATEPDDEPVLSATAAGARLPSVTYPPLADRPGEERTTVGARPGLPSVGLTVAVRALQTSQIAVLVTDALTGEIVWVNDPYCQMVGWSFAELVGRSWEMVHTAQPDEAQATRTIDALTAGETVAMTMLNRRKDGTRFWSRMIITPVRDASGAIAHYLAVHADATGTVVTEHTQAAEAELAANRNHRLELMTQALEVLAEHNDLHQAADALARTAVPELADWGFVVLFDDDGAPEYFTQIVADPAKQESARAVRQDMPRWMEQHQALKVMALARPEDLVLPQLIDIGLLEKTISSPRVLRALDDLGLGARLPVPLCARNRTLGLMVLEARDPDRFDVPTVVTTSMLRGRVGTMLDNIRLYQAERATALTLQHRLLPPSVEVADLDTAAAYRPAGNRAEIGGDWYDVFPLGERGTMLAVGDVVGHDMSAAAVMGQLSLLLRARTWTSGSPGPSLTTIARVLDGMHWDDVASVVCLRWQPTTDGCHVEYTNLGHPAPLVRLPDGRVCQMRPAHGIPLGLHDPTVDLGQDELDLPAGSVVVLYTDGLVERRDRSLEDGLAALARALRDAPDGTTEQIRDHLLATLVHDQPEDDVCLLVVRGQTPAPPDRQIPPAPALLIPLDNVGRPARTTR